MGTRNTAQNRNSSLAKVILKSLRGGEKSENEWLKRGLRSCRSHNLRHPWIFSIRQALQLEKVSTNNSSRRFFCFRLRHGRLNF
ncbi:MAG: hypothetical protein QXQ41_06110 [Candidatus Bathyarchaeia archaeon]